MQPMTTSRSCAAKCKAFKTPVSGMCNNARQLKMKWSGYAAKFAGLWNETRSYEGVLSR